MKTSRKLVDCAECGAGLSTQAEACPECGYPHITPIGDLLTEAGPAESALTESRMLQWGGVVVLAVGFAALLADSRFAAGVALTVGAIVYLSGLLGSWWNRRS